MTSASTCSSAYFPSHESAPGPAWNRLRAWVFVLAFLSAIYGTYGALQGTGGLEAVVKVNGGSKVTTGIVPDLYGHTVATVDASTSAVTWNRVHSDGYGPIPGFTAAQPLDDTHSLASVLAWRGRYIDATGHYWLGARYYNPESGTFLSPDPLGHAASMSLYDFCNGDPVNGFDPTGRCSSSWSNQANSNASAGISAYTHTGEDTSSILTGKAQEYAINQQFETQEAAAQDAIAREEYESHSTLGGFYYKNTTTWSSVGQIALDATPGVNLLSSIYSAATGKEMLTGRWLSRSEINSRTVNAVIGTSLAGLGVVGALSEAASAEVSLARAETSLAVESSLLRTEGAVAAESSGVIKYSARAGGEMGVGSQAALDEALQSPALQNVTLRTQPVYNPTLSSFGRSYAGGYDNYWSQIGNKAFSNDAELVGTIVHEETHLRIFERQLSGGARASALDAAAEEAYVRQVEGRFLRMKGY